MALRPRASKWRAATAQLQELQRKTGEAIEQATKIEAAARARMARSQAKERAKDERDQRAERRAIVRIERYDLIAHMRKTGHTWQEAANAAGLASAGSAYNLVAEIDYKLKSASVGKGASF